MILRFAPLVWATLAAIAADPVVKVVPDVESGVYDPGQKVIWTVRVRIGDVPATGKVAYQVLKGGLIEAGKGSVDLVDGVATIQSTRSDPGTLLLKVWFTASGAAKPIEASGGAAFAPEQVKPSAPSPDDFDAFWKGKVDELAAVPMNAQVEAVDVGDSKVEYFKITLDNIRGAKIQGQIARPAGATGLPAILQVQWAGVYPLERDWVLGHARAGWLAMNILAHDLPIDEKEPFYRQKADKELQDYPGIDNDDREKAYFLRMFLSCYRAVDYLAQRPDWNKAALVVHGGSQGGYQAIVTAGMHPAVTAFAANVPAGCDHTGPQAGRAPGWPNWAGRTWQGKDKAKMTETARYFDAMNFAPRIRCAGLIGLGLIDPVCPAEGVLATVNAMKGPKTVVIMPRSTHGGDGEPHNAYYAKFGPFLEAQKQGPSK